MEISLTQNEAELLRATVEKDMHEMLMEIANADVREFRETLKNKEELLMSIRDKLDQAASVTS